MAGLTSGDVDDGWLVCEVLGFRNGLVDLSSLWGPDWRLADPIPQPLRIGARRRCTCQTTSETLCTDSESAKNTKVTEIRMSTAPTAQENNSMVNTITSGLDP